MRLTSDFFVSAYLRRVAGAGAFAVLRRRGNMEAGAVFIIIDRLDGTGALYGPAPQSSYDGESIERGFALLSATDATPHEVIEKRLGREIAFDPDCWVIEVEERSGKHFLERVL